MSRRVKPFERNVAGLAFALLFGWALFALFMIGG